jgi:hypothetical protein
MMFGASLLGVTPGRPDRPMGRHVSPLTCHPQEDGPSQRPSSGKCSGVQPAREVVVATAVDAAAVVAAAADTLLLLHTTRYDATSSHHDLEAFFFPLLQEAVVAAAVTPLQSSLSRSMRCFPCTPQGVELYLISLLGGLLLSLLRHDAQLSFSALVQGDRVVDVVP